LAPRGQAALGERHADGGDLVARHENSIAVAAQFVGYVLALQSFDDGCRIFKRQAAVQRRKLRSGGAQDEKGKTADHERGAYAHCSDTLQSEPVKKLRDPVHQVTCFCPRSLYWAARQKLPICW